METNYVVILDFSTATVIKIHLSKEQIEESYKYDDFEEFLFTLEPQIRLSSERLLLDDV